MAAVVSPPANMPTPAEVIEAHANAMKVIALRLLTSNERLAKSEAELGTQLLEARDRIHELETKLREQEQISEELRAMKRAR